MLTLLNLFVILKLVSALDLEEEISLLLSVKGEGFHQEVELSGSFPSTWNNCYLLLKWQIPSGIYVDPYQLQSSKENFTFHFTDRVNVESMAHRSPHQVMYLKEKLNCQIIHSCDFFKSIPIHGRYHLPQSGQSVNNDLRAVAEVHPPSLSSSCSGENQLFNEEGLLCNSDTCAFLLPWEEMHVPFKILKNQVTVPVGDLDHSICVSILTVLITFIGTYFVAKSV